MCLAGIFDNHQFVPGRQIQDRVHVRHLTVQVYRHQSRHRLPQPLVNIPARRGVRYAPGLQVLAQLFRVHRKGPRIDVHKFGLRASLTDGLGRRDEGMGHGNDDVARPDAGGDKGEAQGIGSAVDSDTVLRAAELRKLFLESLYFRASDKARCLKNFLAHGQQFGLQFPVHGQQINEWNLRGSTHRFSSEEVRMERNTFAGLPATIALAGTSCVTTLPAPTMAFSPMTRLERMVAPDPMEAPRLTTVVSTRQSFSVCSSPPEVVARG